MTTTRKNKTGALYTIIAAKEGKLWREELTKLLEMTDYNMTHAAQLAELDRANFYRLCDKYKVPRRRAVAWEVA